jgi:hypothetical protein
MNKTKIMTDRLEAIKGARSVQGVSGLPVNKLEENEKLIMSKLGEEIEFPDPIVYLNGEGLIYSNTINIIQGKTGVHKSRLESHMISCLIAKNRDACIGSFTRNRNQKFNVIVIDTERSIKDLLPYSMQTVLEHAGYDKTSPPHNFRVTSMANTLRDNRLSDLIQYLDQLKLQANNDAHYVVFLDVVTDLVDDFNNVGSSLQLVDYLNMLINLYNLTFITVIHENPGVSEKPRGSLGSELSNKASTQIQIVGNKENGSKINSVFQVNIPKSRYNKPIDSCFFTYDPVKKMLAELNKDQGQAFFNKKKEKKADEQDILEEIISHYLMDTWYKKQDWFSYLITQFDCSDKTLKMRIDELINLSPHNGISIQSKREGREILYRIEGQLKIMEEKKYPI